MDLKDLKNLTKSDVTAKPAEPGEQITAIIKVRTAGYVPSGVQVRSRISDDLITADFPATLLDKIQADEQVVSVEHNKPLRGIE
jgi:hypothetical protein